MTDDEIRVGIGGRVKAAREAMLMTQDRLAELIGSCVGSIQNVESGRHAASGVKIVRIAEALGITPADLLPDFGLRFTIDKLRTA